MSSVHAVMLVDGSGRLVASSFSVPTEQVAQVVEQLTRQHSDTALRVMVDGTDVTDAATRTPVTAPKGTGPASELAGPVLTTPTEGERATAELAHHMLWETFKRACQTQGYMLDKMTGCAVEMNRRFVEELETMRGNYTKALERLDGIEFEKRMIEHEAASRRLTAHHLRLAEEDHRAAERRRDDERSVLEQIARGVMRVVDTIGSDSINGSGNGNGKN